MTTRRLSSIVVLLVAIAASIATKGPPPPSVVGLLEAGSGVVPAAGVLNHTLTLELPASVVDAGPTNLQLMVDLWVTPPAWEPDTDDASDSGPRVVRLAIRGDDPSMEATEEVARGDSAFVAVGAPLARCAPGAACTFTYALELSSLEPVDLPFTWSFEATVWLDDEAGGALTLTLDPP